MSMLISHEGYPSFTEAPSLDLDRHAAHPFTTYVPWVLSRVSQQNPVFIPTTPPCPVWSFNISFNELGLFIQAFLGIFAPLPIWHSIIHRQSELVEHGPP